MTRFMTFVKRVLSEKRAAAVLVAAVLAIDAALYAFAVYPWTLKVANADQRAATAAANLESARQRFETARATADGKTQADAVLHTFNREILPQDLAGARAITFARLASLAGDHDLVMERRASLPDRDEHSRLARLRVSMLLKGGYRDMRRFIYALETAPEFLVIEEIVLSQGDAADDAEVLTLGLATYYEDAGERRDDR